MVNESEEVLSAFSQMYFFKELVHDDLKFIRPGDTEKEVADVLLNLGDIIIAIQLKGRNDKDLTDDELQEIKWLGKKCREAKKQIKDSIKFIREGDLPAFENRRNLKINLDSEATIIPLIVFMNEKIDKYKPVVWKHSNDGMNVNCMSFSDFQKLCEILITPIEIANYLEWRLKFYEENGEVDTFIFETQDGSITIAKPKNNEALVYQFLSMEYGFDKATKFESYMQGFREVLHQLPEHTQIRSEDSADFEIVKFFAHFNRMEIQPFIERLNMAIQKSRVNDFDLVGSLRNTQSKYLVVFLSAQQDVTILNDVLLEIAPNKGDIDIIMQIVVYWINSSEYRIDFHHYKYG